MSSVEWIGWVSGVVLSLALAGPTSGSIVGPATETPTTVLEKSIAAGERHFAASRYKKALAAFEEADREAGGESIAALLGMGNSHFMLGDWRESIECAESVLDLSSGGPWRVAGLYLLGVSLLASSEGDADTLQQAEAALDEVVEAPDEEAASNATWQRAKVREGLNRPGEALEDYRRLVGHPALGIAARTIVCELKRKFPEVAAVRTAKRPMSMEELGTSTPFETPPECGSTSEGPDQVSDCIVPPVKIRSARPVYTLEASRKKIQGVIVIRSVVDIDGCAVDHVLLEGLDPGLDRNAIAAIESWLYEPARFRGEAVPVYYNITISFHSKERVPTPKRKKVEGLVLADGSVAEVTPPRKVYGPRPDYPASAKEARIQGEIVVQAIIDRQGNVTNVKILKGLPSGLDRLTEEAVRTWKFEPAMLKGEPVAVYYNLTVNFRLE